MVISDRSEPIPPPKGLSPEEIAHHQAIKDVHSKCRDMLVSYRDLSVDESAGPPVRRFGFVTPLLGSEGAEVAAERDIKGGIPRLKLGRIILTELLGGDQAGLIMVEFDTRRVQTEANYLTQQVVEVDRSPTTIQMVFDVNVHPPVALCESYRRDEAGELKIIGQRPLTTEELEACFKTLEKAEPEVREVEDLPGLAARPLPPSPNVRPA